MNPTKADEPIDMRMGIYMRMALLTIVIGWAATCDEQTDGHRARE